MCDRVLLFSSNPGRVASEIKIDLPQPRDRTSPQFEDYVDQIYVEMTARRVERMRQAQAPGNAGIEMPLHPCLAQPDLRPDRGAGGGAL